jgi:diguanylate cyclase (GGDEF)-like protein
MSGKSTESVRSGADLIRSTREKTDVGKPISECRIIVVDDDEGVRKLYLQYLKQMDCQGDSAANESELRDVLNKYPAPDLVVMDLDLGRSNRDGLELIARFEEIFGIRTNFVIISGRGDYDVLADLVPNRSVLDFIEKPLSYEQFSLRLRMALADAHERDKDRILGIPHKAAYETKMSEHLRTWRRDLIRWVEDREYAAGRCFDLTLVLMDIDDFSAFNNNYGYRVGDYVLIEGSNAIDSRLRVGDFFARYGGEEFVLLMPCTDCVNARTVFDRISWEFSNQSLKPEKGIEHVVTFSAGIATPTFDLYMSRPFLNSLGLENKTWSRTEEAAGIQQLRSHVFNAANWALKQVKDMKHKTDGSYRGHSFPGNALELCPSPLI